MASESKTYTNIDRAKVNDLRSAISAFVKLPDGDSGTIESQGMKGTFAYDEPARTLTLTIDEVPFFIPRAMVWSNIERVLGQ
jgi:hypothetical protein